GRESRAGDNGREAADPDRRRVAEVQDVRPPGAVRARARRDADGQQVRRTVLRHDQERAAGHVGRRGDDQTAGCRRRRTAEVTDMKHLEHLQSVADEDVRHLLRKEKTYRGRWKRRGGVGAFMMAARKWDRLENMSETGKYDIFDMIAEQPGGEDGTT